MTNLNVTLVTGGRGKTGRRISSKLKELQYSVRTTGRSNRSDQTDSDYVRFDWYDESTYPAALSDVSNVYMIAPVGDMNPVNIMEPFIKKAIENGVKRFVLLSSASISENGPVLGEVHQVIKQLAPEWTVLQPSYFMENFTESHHAGTIKNNNAIYSAAGDGKIGFVSANDIADVAVRALTDKQPHNTAHVITGPQSLTYGDVAQILNFALGKSIKHISLSDKKLQEALTQAGIPNVYAEFLAGLDAKIREEGSENQVTDTVMRVTGHAPLSFEQFVKMHLDTWN
ncbi:ergot alkaloid biosynthesis protein [Paenibacillus agricola]|uniref:Ergot alkaloid biosynthesis protein n=1 Tax=Paenibacillus agricola TaxID=2716264 RepID=A0ABX0JF15_9BACL|nr:ergot alkaloid biosynthesis protein [Paenibacillus agricola]NHN34493.1 ergot alkaloid biosynthesis protein [Paenibacillus agricola]